jgi:AAA+ ATPase superfamily predicted ATPase
MNKKTNNPFITSGYVSKEYFCDREAETTELLQALCNGRNTVLISPRRMGKTGLIQHCFHVKEIKQDYYTFFIDIYATSNLKELVYAFGKQIFETLKPKGKQFIEQFFQIITSLRPAFKLDPVTGSPVFDIGIGEIHQPGYSLEQIFLYLEKAEKPCLVAIDEFQQISKYPEKNMEAILRTYTQQCTNTTFVFSGSQRHTIQNIFFSASRPFYQSASLLNLNAIAMNKYISFVQKHFRKAGKKISNATIERVYNLLEGHTWYIQNLFNRLYAFLDEGEEASIEWTNKCLHHTVTSYESMFQGILSLLSERQKELLYAIAKEGKASEITSAAFIKKHALLSSSSIQTASKQLFEKDLITKENNVYQVYDRFFGLWLSERYGTGYSL